MVLKRILPVAFVLLMLGPGAASAHGDLGTTIPAAGSRLGKPPDHLIINFTEPPTKNSVVKVKDGCANNITDSVSFSDKVAHVFTDEGQPGKWKVSYEIVSAADGHKSDGGYGFTVSGKKDCSPEEEPTNEDKNGGDGSGPGTQAKDGNGGDDDGSFPVIPVVIGGAGVIALALVARRLAG